MKPQQYFHKPYLIVALCFIMTGVGLGAFGAHGLSNILDEHQLSTFETAVRYQMYHGIALLIVSVSGHVFTTRCWTIGQKLLIAGTFVFSVSLYLYLATQVSLFAMATPLGGSALILGWLWLIVGVIKGSNNHKDKEAN